MVVPTVCPYLTKLEGIWDAAPVVIQLPHIKNAFLPLTLQDGNSLLSSSFKKIRLLSSIQLTYIFVLF